MMTGQPSIGEIALGAQRDALGRIAGKGRQRKPLIGAFHDLQPPPGSSRRHADLPAKLAIVDLLGVQRTHQLDKATKTLPVYSCKFPA